MDEISVIVKKNDASLILPLSKCRMNLIIVRERGNKHRELFFDFILTNHGVQERKEVANHKNDQYKIGL